MTNGPWKGRGYITWPILNIWESIHISEISEARAFKFSAQRDYIKSCQRDDKSPPKGTWLGSRDPYLHAQLWSWKNFATRPTCHFRRRWTFVAHTFGVRRQWCYTLRLNLHRFDLSLYLLQTCFYNVNNKSTKWSMSITMHVCANNRHVRVCCVVMCFRYHSQRLLPGNYTRSAVEHEREVPLCGPSTLADLLILKLSCLNNQSINSRLL